MVALGLSLQAAAQSYHVLSDGYDGLQLRFSAAAPQVGEHVADGRIYSTLTMESLVATAPVGAPELPTFTGLIEVPFCKGYEVEVTEAEYDTLAPLPHPLLPAQPSRSKSDSLRRPLTIDAKSYATDAFTGGSVRVRTVGIARDRRMARLEYCPVQYNPVSGRVVVCRSATLSIRYRGVDSTATRQHFDRYHTPAFSIGAASLNSLYPKSVSTAAPVRYLIVAHSMFRGQLDSFVEWKRRKGFIADIVYTDDPAVGSDTTSIAAYLQGQYTGATASSPAPTYLLLVGDVAQIPPFAGRTDEDHITDLYYTTWTAGDHLPDCYCGRFSAQNVSQLTPQIEKTLMYEQYTFADPSFLDRAVLVAGVDGGDTGDFGYTYADPAMDYAIINYINGGHGFSSVRYFKNNTAIVPAGSNVYVDGNSSSMSATVRGYYNQGAGLINYSAHGSSTSWGTPNFTTSHVEAMTNSQKYGIMIGNCCLTNKFETPACLGEALLRKGNYCGAVGYIGGSNSTYWGEDFYWAVGVRSGISATMSMAYNSTHLGIYDRLCHTHNETYPQWATSQGSLMMWGNMAVESSTSSLKHYYWEIYHLMGDPSVMPYLTQASPIDVTVSSHIPYGTTSLSVGTVAHAYVALTDTLTHSVVAATWADDNGDATLSLPATLQAGGYELALSAQQHRTTFYPVSILLPDGAFVTVVDAVPQMPLDAGSARPLDVRIANVGDSTARGITLELTTSDSAALALSPGIVAIDSLAAGDTLVVGTTATVAPLVGDGDEIRLTASLGWSGSPYNPTCSLPLTLNAPRLTAQLGHVPHSLQAGQSVSFAITISNQGHLTQPASRVALTSPTALLAVSEPSIPLTLAPSASLTHTFTVSADSLLPDGIHIPVSLGMGERPIATLHFYIGAAPHETFEGNSYHTEGWIHGSHAWQLTDAKARQGSYSLRSAVNLDHHQTSDVTLHLDLPTADSLTFHYSVSSEANYDKFHLYLDDDAVLTASGTVDWTRFARLIPAGSHTLRFAYSKDVSVSNGSDCAWIDDVRLPRYDRASVSFRHDDLCEGATYLLGSDTIDTRHPGNGSHVVQGDDSIAFVDYTVHGISDTVVSVEVCDRYTFLGNSYTDSDSLVFTLADRYGCDSSVTLLLTVHHSVTDTVEVCAEGPAYQWNGASYRESGVYMQQFATVDGCDSTVILLLTLTDPATQGIAEGAEMSVSLYPNPTASQVRLSRPVLRADLYDLRGRRVQTHGATDRLDLGALPAGTYLLRLTLPEGEATCRIVRR